MKHSTKLTIAAVCGLLAAALCAALLMPGSRVSAEDVKPLHGDDPKPAPVPQKTGNDFRDAYAKLALALLKNCRTEKGEQVMVSPLSVLTALGMTANGAAGETRSQMETVLGGGAEIETINEWIYGFTAGLSSGEGAALSAANSLWVSPKFKVENAFLNAVQNLYDAETAQVDFGKAKKAADLINAWCDDKTDGMIEKVVKENDFSDLTMMVLVNALCFDAKWEDPYSEENRISKGNFRGTNGTKEVEFLRESGFMPYLSGENETGFVKYYEGRKYAFAALLPKIAGDPAEYLATLTAEKWLALWDGQQTMHVSTALPKFKQETDLELQELLSAMGMDKAFSTEADFSRMGRAENGMNVNIDKVIHKTFIEVNNEGTRAAAVTAVEMKCGAAFDPDPKSVILDRPFVYAIVDVETGLPVFVGTCEDFKNGTEALNGIPSFSYQEDKARCPAGTPGVKYDGFVNTTTQTVKTKEDAIERAANECTVEWDTVSVWYDAGAKVWKVSFGFSGMAGGDESVYVSENGKTLLIVYGE